MQIAVVGAGIAGITAAYYLAKKGHSVVVYDKERYPAMRTSYANGGQISVSNSEVWTTWSNVRRGIGWMFRKDAPLWIKPTLEYRKLRWLAAFLVNTLRGRYQSNTAETIRLGLLSRQLLRQIASDEGLEFDQSWCGILHFYRDPKYFAAAQQAQELYESNGCDWQMVNTQDMLRIEPTLTTTNMVGGAWTPSDWTGDIHKFCVQLAQVLETRYGVEFVYDSHIQHVDQLDSFDKVVVANGVEAYHLAKTAGDTLPIYPVKGYSITIELDEVSAQHAPHVSLLDDQAKIVASRLGNRFRVAGTAELAGENWDIRQDRVQPLLDWVRVNFPNVNTSRYSSWACLRPMTPDMLPRVGRSANNPRVYYHVGHGHLGWTLSAATAHQIADMISENTTT
jgi:D-amino-acid dehydrogenase